jgi:hypothetical protein
VRIVARGAHGTDEKGGKRNIQKIRSFFVKDTLRYAA